MKTPPILIAATALLALAGCSKNDDADRGAKATATTGELDIEADSETGNLELKLPGGFEAKFKVPGGLPSEAKFDIDGVGLYPGAKIQRLKVDAGNKAGDRTATVVLGFQAPADPPVVADWYEKQFADNKITARRSGETLDGKTGDGNDFTLALASGGAGVTQGTLTILDIKKG